MRVTKLLGVILGITLFSAVCSAGDFSFTGNLANVNQVQFFTFTVTSGSTVTIQSYSYAGGTNSAGRTIVRGGFDPSITLFYGTGASAPSYKIGDDEYGCAQGTRDTISKVCYDVYWEATSQPADPNSDVVAFEPGTYTVALTNYGNFAGVTLGDAFSGTGSALDCNGNRRTVVAGTFNDCLRTTRDGHWALDIKGVTSAQMAGVAQAVAPVTTTTTTTTGGGGSTSGGGSGGGSGKGGGSGSGGGGGKGGADAGVTTTTTTGTTVVTTTSGGGSGKGGNGGGGGRRGAETGVTTATTVTTTGATQITSGSGKGGSSGGDGGGRGGSGGGHGGGGH